MKSMIDQVVAGEDPKRVIESRLIDITNLTDTGLDVILDIAAVKDFELPAGLSNADLDAIKAELVKRGADPVRTGKWLVDYMARQKRLGNVTSGERQKFKTRLAQLRK